MESNAMSSELPSLAGCHHVGFTVPDIEAATAFFVNVIGCKVIYEVGPFEADDNWMSDHLNVHPRARVSTLRMLKCRNGPAFELFQYEAPDQRTELPKNSDHGGHHLGFYVADMDSAVAYLKGQGVEFQGEPTAVGEGPMAGLTWVYFLSPWGMQLELISHPDGMAYESTSPDRLWSPLDG
jgi:glyoxylase I family protein